MRHSALSIGYQVINIPDVTVVILINYDYIYIHIYYIIDKHKRIHMILFIWRAQVKHLSGCYMDNPGFEFSAMIRHL